MGWGVGERPLFLEARWGEASWPASGCLLDSAYSQDYSPWLPQPSTGTGCAATPPQASSWRDGRRQAPSGPVAVITGVELAKKGSIQLCPGIIIHCGMVNRCHEAQQLAKHMKPKFPSFAGFSIYFLVDFAS